METIHFRLIDRTQPVMAIVALTVDDKAKTIEQMNEFFTKKGIFYHSSRLKIVDMKKIVGNVEGDKGRTDYLLYFNRDPNEYVNEDKRLTFEDLKWIDDYLDNYSSDYKELMKGE